MEPLDNHKPVILQTSEAILALETHDMDIQCIENEIVYANDNPNATKVKDQNYNSSIDLIRNMLMNMNDSMVQRFQSVEEKLEDLSQRTTHLEEQILAKGHSKKNKMPRHAPYRMDNIYDSQVKDEHDLQMNGVNVLSLNSKDDYLNGSWLGYINNPEMRVRVPIRPSDMIHINTNCHSPEKLALTLLDYLFDKESQATSNISGQGKHMKKKLNPLFIYGIRCHLIFRYNIEEEDWHRIKLNIDSKCRTAFRRKQRGHSFGKSHHDMLPEDNSLISLCKNENIYEKNGPIQVINASAEDLENLRQQGTIQIINGDEMPNYSGNTNTNHYMPYDTIQIVEYKDEK